MTLEGKEFEFGSRPILETLNKFHDLMYKVIRRPSEICTLIEQASQTGSVKSLVLDAHGTPDEMYFSVFDTLKQTPSGGLSEIDSNCFTGLAPDAEITLVSCSTGKSENSIAAAIAKAAKRIVWAPSDTINSIETVFSPSVPAIPSFWKINPKGNEYITCKFYPEGEYYCNPFTSKVFPAIKRIALEYISKLFLGNIRG